MLKNLTLFAASILMLGGIALGADKVKLSTLGPAADFAEEINTKVGLLEKSLADEAAYDKDKKKSVPREAGTLAVLAQAVVEHDEDSPLKKSAADVRNAALALVKAGSYADAKKSLEDIKAAIGGKSSGAAPEADWAKLIDMDSLMHEVGKRNAAAIKATKKIPADTKEAVRNLEVIALLSIPMAADTHEVKDKAQLPTWEQYCTQMRDGAIATAKAVSEKNSDAAKKAYDAVKTSCSKCHEEIRDK